MRILGIKSKIRQKRYNYIKVKPEQVGENILSRDFSANYPNEKWLTDVTEFKVLGQKQKIYLCSILDLYDKSIVAYTISFRNDNKLVFDTFDKAIALNPTAKPIFHSDRGFQFTSKVSKFKLDQQGMIQSMSRVGKCIDNGPMESFWGFLKTEMYYLRKFDTFEELKTAVEEYIYYYNNKRYQEKLGCLSPMEYHEKMTA
jgi:transposase InsO family protein